MFQIRVFSTAGLPAARRIELWEGHNTAALIGLTCHTAVPLEATEVNVQLGRTHLARVTGSPHVVERTAEVIRRSPADAVVIGPGREVTDIYYDWARIREVAEEGAILVRPDKHVGWRSMGLPEDPERSLREAMSSLLGRDTWEAAAKPVQPAVKPIS
jgi:hypothetical protein